jgi:hypothetical protein
MEPEAKEFLLKVASSISMALLWLVINSTTGIAFKFAFFEKKPGIGNYIFYIWFLLSLGGLIIYYRRKWKF